MTYPFSLLRNIVVAIGLVGLVGTGITPSVMAQTTSGDVVGVVKDASGAVVPNAAITISNEATGVTVSTKSGQSGDYRLSNLLPGTYDITFVVSGFSPYKLKALAVSGSKTSTVDATLVAATSQQVEVESIAPTTLDTTTTNLSTTLSNEELSVLPTATVGLGVLNTSLLAPGVASSGGVGIGTGPSVGGQRPRSNNFMIEGIDNNDKGVTGPELYVPNDAVGDFTLITSQFSPEFGHSAGGQFNTTVVSGTNHLHGRLYEYFDNRNLNAELGSAGSKVSPNPRYDFNRYGGQLGGPIVKDRLFAFSNFERQTTGQNLNYYICTPTAAGLATLNSLNYGFNATNLAQFTKYIPAANAFGGSQAGVGTTPDLACGNPGAAQAFTVYSDTAPNASTGEFGTANPVAIPLGNYLVNAPTFTNFDASTTSLDYTISQKDSFRGRYLYNTEGTQDTAAALPVFFQTLPFRYHLIALSEFHNFTPNLINELRVGFNRYATAYPAGNYQYPGLDQFPNLSFNDIGQEAYSIGPDGNAPQSTIQNLYQVTDNVSYTKGRHSWKFGFDGRKYIAPQTFTQRVRGDYYWINTGEFLHDLAPTDFGQRSTGNFIYYGDQTALYGYANDTFRATSKITFNVGLRYEFTSVPVGERAQSLNSAASVAGVLSIHAPQPSYTNFAPRFGINFAPDDKTSIRAGFGLAYDVLFDNLGLLSFPPQYSSTNTVGDGNTNYTGKVNPDFGSANFLTGGGLPPGNGGLATFPTIAAQKAATAAFVPDQVIPYSENYNFQIQRVFHRDTTITIGYLGTRGIHLPTQIQLNKQPKVNTANQLPTLLSTSSVIPVVSGGKTAYYTQNTTATANNLGVINAGSSLLPAFASAGFTGTITSYQPFSQSNYNGLTINATRNLRNGLQFNLSYTWSKTMDDATAEVFATALTPRRPLNSQNVAADYSRSALDRTHRITLESVYNLHPFKGSNWMMRNLVGNWTVSPIYTYESPEFATVLNSGVNNNITGDSGTYINRPILNPAGNKSVGSGVLPIYSLNATLVAQCINAGNTAQCPNTLVGYVANNPAAGYIQAGLGTLSTAGRNTLPTRPINNVDMTAIKRLTFHDHYSVEVGAQAFNLFNHAQYTPGSVNNINSIGQTGALAFQSVNSSQFGDPTQAFSNNGRSLQLSGKIVF